MKNFDGIRGGCETKHSPGHIIANLSSAVVMVMSMAVMVRLIRVVTLNDSQLLKRTVHEPTSQHLRGHQSAKKRVQSHAREPCKIEQDKQEEGDGEHRRKVAQDRVERVVSMSMVMVMLGACTAVESSAVATVFLMFMVL